MKVLRKLWNLIRGKTHAVLDQFDDPQEQLSVFVEELNKQVKDLQRSVAAAIADEKRLKMELDEVLNKASDWEKRAHLALDNGDESLAKEALVKKGDCEEHSKIIHKNWETQKSATDTLKTNLSQARSRVSDAKRQYTLLLARFKSAETKQKMVNTLSTKSDSAPSQIMERLNDKILQIEAETDANLEMMGDTAAPDIEARFAQLENKDKADDALAKLKAERASRGQIEGPGEAQSADDIADMKAKLKKG